ncbi:hypothetical protein G3I71_43680 [Streptomyces sp. SID12501]|uniref:Lipoprotein n=1 Tax=Streptomyces sp. SID12501 TaxID=2706042 RepID=A0A6B3C7T1_9ACTN|nr:hypothetical protein [Streptomyces sp. SID12501]
MRACATTTVGVLALSLITGCGGGDSDESKNSGASATTQAGKTAKTAKAATEAELEKLLVTTADVTGYKAESTTAEAKAADSKSDLKIAAEVCAPIAYAVSGFAPGDEAAVVQGKVTQDAKKPTDAASESTDDVPDAEWQAEFAESMNIDMTFLTLSSYDGDGAEKAMKAVSDAVAGCTGGFSISGSTDNTKYTKIAPVKASGVGDESVAFSATGEPEEPDGATGFTYGEVVRYGNTIAAYTTINLSKVVSGKPYTISAPVVKAQSARLK